MPETRKTITAQVDNQSTTGFVERREYTFAERMTRGLKIAGVLWLVAVVTLFVPILHFILVPSFLILGIVFGWAAWHDKAEVIRGEFICPNCKRTIPIPRESENFPCATRCTECQFTVNLTAM